MRQRSIARVWATTSLVALIAAGAGGCASMHTSDVTASINRPDALPSDADWRKARDTYGPRYRANPKDPDAALRFGQALRALGEREQAVAVLEQASIAAMAQANAAPQAVLALLK